MCLLSGAESDARWRADIDLSLLESELRHMIVAAKCCTAFSWWHVPPEARRLNDGFFPAMASRPVLPKPSMWWNVGAAVWPAGSDQLVLITNGSLMARPQDAASAVPAGGDQWRGVVQAGPRVVPRTCCGESGQSGLWMPACVIWRLPPICARPGANLHLPSMAN